jgi:hypothetical protein
MSADTLLEDIHQDIWTWLNTFVSVKNSVYDGKFAPCPFARAAIVTDKVDVKVYAGGDVRRFIRDNAIDLRDNGELSTRVMAFPPRIQGQWGIDEFIETVNAELIKDDVFLNPGVTKTLKSRYPGSAENAPYYIVVANRLDAVLSGSEALKKTAYYKNWPRDQYQLVVERRDRLAKRYRQS